MSKDNIKSRKNLSKFELSRWGEDPGFQASRNLFYLKYKAEKNLHPERWNGKCKVYAPAEIEEYLKKCELKRL